jgi:hypothetical protein
VRLFTRRRLLYGGLLVAMLAPGCPSMCANQAYSHHLGDEGWDAVYDLPPQRVWPEVRAVLAQRNTLLPERVPAIDEEVVGPWEDRLNYRERYRVTLASRFLRGGYRIRIVTEQSDERPENRTHSERTLTFEVLERINPDRARVARSEAEADARRARASCQACWSGAELVLQPGRRADAGITNR